MKLVERVLSVAVLASATLLSGCGSFFVCQKASCPASGGGGGTNTGDFVYVSNTTSGSNYVAGYSITSGVLTSIPAALVDVGFTPIAMVVSPNNGFLYVASAGGAQNPGVYVYTISSTGGLAAANNGNVLINDETIAAMAVSPDGNYLLTVGTSALAGVIVSEYTLSTTTGLVTAGPATFSTVGTSCAIGGSPLTQQCTIEVSPSKDYVGVALAQAGFEIFPYSSTTGMSNAIESVGTGSTASGDYSLAFDLQNDLYVASTLALTSYGGISGTTAPVVESTETYASGVTPRSVTLSTSYGYVYVANQGSGTISGYSQNGAGVLTEVGAAEPGPESVSALAADNSGDYLVAAGYSATNGLQLFSISSTTGALTTASSFAGTGTDLTVPALVAVTHPD